MTSDNLRILSGCWILALSKEVDSSISLVGADISSTMFPDSHPRNVQFVETSVTNMPEKWTETFDFINQRFLIAALTATQWAVALKELYRVLKPGGTIQITELHSFNPVGEGLRKSGEVWKKFMSLLEEKGHLSDSGYRIKDFARNAGFENVEESVQRAPIGRRWGKLGEAGAENLKRGLRVLEPANIGRGGLENVNTCTKSQSLVECARQEWDNCEGLYLSVTVVTARKPL